MTQFIEWFSTTYPEHKEALLNCHHNFDEKETNPYHVEGDCWSHTMMVCKIAELKGYEKVVQISALLHDLGKPSSRKINPKNNHVQFFGHEEKSTLLARPLLEVLAREREITQEESLEIEELILLHGTLYKLSHEEIIEKFKGKEKFFRHLVELVECDSLGRFTNSYDFNKEALLNLFK